MTEACSELLFRFEGKEFVKRLIEKKNQFIKLSKTN